MNIALLECSFFVFKDSLWLFSSSSKRKYKCYGEDINYNNQLLTRIRLYFTGCYSHISENNILNSEYSEEVDVAFAHTPFVMRIARDVDWYNRLNKYVGKY